jgi:hypothetical protein
LQNEELLVSKLPNYKKAIIDPDKIKNYILSPAHPVGRFKAAFFQSMGYTQENWQQFLDDIREYHLTEDAEPVEKTEYGQKYIITGEVKGPNGKIILLRSVWIVLSGEDTPRFITIYPEGG